MSERLLEDGTSKRKLEDGTSTRLLEDGASGAATDVVAGYVQISGLPAMQIYSAGAASR